MSEDFVLTKLEQLEAIIGEIRAHLKGASVELPFDADKIKWTDATDRNNRAYRLATIQNNIHNEDFQKAKELLKSGGGTFKQKNGLSWLLFPDGDAIGVWDYKTRR
jgi:hypothetical protein